VYGDGHRLIDDPEVDAVVIASIPETHEELILACLKASRPVLCEKPLTASVDASRRVVAAEASAGQRLVQVGFMRRFDPGYVQLKRRLDDGEIGDALLVHCAHRNADAPSTFGTQMAITDSVVHEIDVVRWLLAQEIVAATVFAGRATRHAPAGVHDPLIVLLETDGGVLVDVESFVRARYGYDIRCEVVGENGTLTLAPSAVSGGFDARFAQAYRDELQAWVDAVGDGRMVVGATAWDGYVASAVTEACARALGSGRREDVIVDTAAA
jgi:myo-inositol 2-dehydrogenase / D-chiro-inositol 1-dehydrogenase